MFQDLNIISALLFAFISKTASNEPGPYMIYPLDPQPPIPGQPYSDLHIGSSQLNIEKIPPKYLDPDISRRSLPADKPPYVPQPMTPPPPQVLKKHEQMYETPFPDIGDVVPERNPQDPDDNPYKRAPRIEIDPLLRRSGAMDPPDLSPGPARPDPESGPLSLLAASLPNPHLKPPQLPAGPTHKPANPPQMLAGPPQYLDGPPPLPSVLGPQHWGPESGPPHPESGPHPSRTTKKQSDSKRSLTSTYPPSTTKRRKSSNPALDEEPLQEYFDPDNIIDLVFPKSNLTPRVPEAVQSPPPPPLPSGPSSLDIPPKPKPTPAEGPSQDQFPADSHIVKHGFPKPTTNPSPLLKSNERNRLYSSGNLYHQKAGPRIPTVAPYFEPLPANPKPGYSNPILSRSDTGRPFPEPGNPDTGHPYPEPVRRRAGQSYRKSDQGNFYPEPGQLDTGHSYPEPGGSHPKVGVSYPRHPPPISIKDLRRSGKPDNVETRHVGRPWLESLQRSQTQQQLDRNSNLVNSNQRQQNFDNGPAYPNKRVKDKPIKRMGEVLFPPTRLPFNYYDG